MSKFSKPKRLPSGGLSGEIALMSRPSARCRAILLIFVVFAVVGLATMMAAPSPSPRPGSASAKVSPMPYAVSPAVSPSPAKTRIGTLASPSPAFSPTPSPTPGAFARTAAVARQNLKWILIGLAVFVGLSAAATYLMQRDLRQRQVESRYWRQASYVPFLGYGVYQLWRQAEVKLEARRANKHRLNFEFLDEEHHPISINVNTETEASGLENAKHILEMALRKRASDIHIEPTADEYRVRYRIDGFLYLQDKFTPADGLRLVSAIKTVAQIDIAERRKAQDGRFGGRIGGREVDFRVATTPSVIAEKLVIRILDLRAGVRGLEDLGMPPEMKSKFAQVIQSRAGMILATGPTGSGKTSTLYAALRQLDSVQLNLVTIEDPVEYELAGATQIPVNPKAGVTYESGLRSILRQDPDVILVGEMRDLEAGQIALRSALTGHLVFSSLHTKDAIGTISRLEEMGIERHLLASALFVVMSQRLVRVLCPACRVAYPCEGQELAEVGVELNPGDTIYRPVGCRKCDGSGYQGRTGVFEMLVLDDELRHAVSEGMSETEFTRLARAKGYRGYREEAALKVLLGETSVDEVLKAV